MKKYFHLFLTTSLLGVLLQLPAGCSCGFDCSGSSNNNNNSGSSASLTLGFSDSLPEELTEVVINVTSISFRRSDLDDVVVNNFTISEQGLTNASDFQVDLLEYQGTDQLLVLQNFRLEPGVYDQVFIDMIVGSNSNTYVRVRADDTQQPLDVPPNGRLVLSGMELSSGSQSFTVEFALAQSLRFDETDGYQLTADGIRIENNDTDASLSGEVDSALFDSVTACAEKDDPTTGNRVYLYRGGNVQAGQMADVFNPDNTNTPVTGVAPFAVAAVQEDDDTTGVFRYEFGFLPQGSYTLAFSCNTEGDDSVEWDELDIPLPDNQIYQIELSEPEAAQCNLSVDAGVCSAGPA
jgi:hypothetical protein